MKRNESQNSRRDIMQVFRVTSSSFFGNQFHKAKMTNMLSTGSKNYLIKAIIALILIRQNRIERGQDEKSTIKRLEREIMGFEKLKLAIMSQPWHKVRNCLELQGWLLSLFEYVEKSRSSQFSKDFSSEYLAHIYQYKLAFLSLLADLLSFKQVFLFLITLKVPKIPPLLLLPQIQTTCAPNV